jgi:hypothetical protein
MNMKTKAIALSALAFLALASFASAQNFGAAFAGFDTGSDEPIQIEADKLEVRDTDKQAICRLQRGRPARRSRASRPAPRSWCAPTTRRPVAMASSSIWRRT